MEGKIAKVAGDLLALKKLQDAKLADEAVKAILLGPGTADSSQPRLENFSNKRVKIEQGSTNDDDADDNDQQRNNYGTPNKNNNQNRYSRNNNEAMADNRRQGNNNGRGRNYVSNSFESNSGGDNGNSNNGGNNFGNNNNQGNGGGGQGGYNEGRNNPGRNGNKLNLMDAIKQGIANTLGDNMFHDMDQAAGKIRGFIERKTLDKTRLARFLEGHMTKKALSTTGDSGYNHNMARCADALERIFQRSLGN